MSSPNLHKNARPQSRWDEAIADAERKIAKLQMSIQTFKEMKEKGESFPGEKPKRKGK